jgi:hypothetical protein
MAMAEIIIVVPIILFSPNLSTSTPAIRLRKIPGISGAVAILEN